MFLSDSETSGSGKRENTQKKTGLKFALASRNKPEAVLMQSTKCIHQYMPDHTKHYNATAGKESNHT